MKFKVGQKVLLRDGTMADIVDIAGPDEQYPIVYKQGGYTYTCTVSGLQFGFADSEGDIVKILKKKKKRTDREKLVKYLKHYNIGYHIDSGGDVRIGGICFVFDESGKFYTH